MGETDDGNAPFSVLIVCTANQCRSPMIEHLLRRTLRERGVRWEISSAGTHARPGAPMSGNTAVVLDKHGITVSGWRSRALQPEMIEHADLVLTAEATHRSRVVTMHPNALSYTFTLLQFARVCAHLEPLSDPTAPAAGTRLLEGVRIVRSHVQPGAPGSDDIADPIGRRMKAYRVCADIVAGAVADIGNVLSPADAAPENVWASGTDDVPAGDLDG